MMHSTHNVTLTHCNMMHGTHVTLTHCNMMHGTHNITLTHCNMMHSTCNITLTHCHMMHDTHNITLTHCNMMHGTHNVKVIKIIIQVQKFLFVHCLNLVFDNQKQHVKHNRVKTLSFYNHRKTPRIFEQLMDYNVSGLAPSASPIHCYKICVLRKCH